MRKRFIRAIGTLLVLSMVSGCGNTVSENGSNNNNETIENNESIDNNENNDNKGNTDDMADTESLKSTVTAEESHISAELTLDKTEYAAGEDINFTLRLANDKKYYRIAKGTYKYVLSDGLTISDTGFDYSYPVIQAGADYTFTGTIKGDENVIYSGASLKNVTKGEFKEASSNDADIVKLNLMQYVTYNGCECVVKFTFELKVYQNPLTLTSAEKNNPVTITCHDPSIFLDFDGTYYLFGTHMGMGYSTDLRNWTTEDGIYRLSYTQETIEKIREWNDDDSSGSWYGYLWAPDIIYNETMGKYCIYLSADGDNWISNIVLLTSDNVKGPYDYAGSVLYGGFTADTYSLTDAERVTGESTIPTRYVTNGVKNKKWGDEYPNVIDPCVFYDDDGKLWMSYGSWSGGIFIIELDETTGLRDYNVTYETNKHSDAYFGKKIAGGKYVSGEGSYIQKIGDYYYLFISYGGLEAASGYNIRYYRSETPDGEYLDALGNSAFYDTYKQNYNDTKGIRIFGGYKWRCMSYAQVSQGHNSAFVDNDGKAYIVFHTRTSNGTEGHYVKIHQLFVNSDGWLVAAPYSTDGETLDAEMNTVSNITGDYEVIMHNLSLNYKKYETNKTDLITLNSDGTITGDYTGTWSITEGTSSITLILDGKTYNGVTLSQNVENTKISTIVFTALGTENQITVWGSKCID